LRALSFPSVQNDIQNHGLYNDWSRDYQLATSVSFDPKPYGMTHKLFLPLKQLLLTKQMFPLTIQTSVSSHNRNTFPCIAKTAGMTKHMFLKKQMFLKHMFLEQMFSFLPKQQTHNRCFSNTCFWNICFWNMPFLSGQLTHNSCFLSETYVSSYNINIWFWAMARSFVWLSPLAYCPSRQADSFVWRSSGLLNTTCACF